jgi:hypothetical protein
MTTNELLMFMIGIALSCGVFALLLVVYPRLAPRSGNLVQAGVESALQPVIFQAIMAAYRLSEKSVDQGHARLRGADKKQLADDVYRLLPDYIGAHDIAFVKSLISRERFQMLVQNVFDQFDRFYLQNHEHFNDQFKRWADQNKPMLTTSIPPTSAI